MSRIVITEFMDGPAVERLRAAHDVLYDAKLVDDAPRLLAEAAAAAPDAAGYAIQAAIAAVHAEAGTFDATDWAQIAVLYRLLEAHDDGPVVRLGRAVAVGRAQRTICR